MGALYATDPISLKPITMRFMAVLCCLLVLFGAVTSLIVLSGRNTIWSGWSMTRKSLVSNDHLQVFEEDRDEHYALAYDEQTGFIVDHQTADMVTIASIAETTQAADYNAASRYLLDQTITLYLDKNIIGSSE